IRDREAEGVGEDDPELQALLEEEEAREEQYAYAKVTLAELPYDVALKSPNAIAAKVFLPKLKDRFWSRQHNEMVSIVFYEAGLGTADSPGNFAATVPQTMLVTKYLQSLESVSEVFERAMDVAV
ncbi:hypothetical protein FOZ63_013911, partial [Perkinsus olseni]